MDATEVKKNWGKVESLIKPTDMPLTALERAEIRHAARTPEQVEAIKQRWQEREDNMALSSAIGIEQGKQMTFDEANEMRGNPHYAEDVQFRVNCQSAVVANELRRQGWDVEAFGNTKAVNTTPLALSKMTEAAWLDTDGNIPKHDISKYDNLQTLVFKRSNDARGRLLSHCEETSQLLSAEYVWNNPQKMKFIRNSPLGEGKDMTLEKNIKNIAKKKKRHVVSYNIYEYIFKNETWVAVIEVLECNQEQLYAVYKKK